MESRNLILAIVLSIGVLLIWSLFVEDPYQQPMTNNNSNVNLDSSNLDSLESQSIDEIEDILEANDTNSISLDIALREDERVQINTNNILGSINLKGLKIDDITLKNYKETLDKESDLIRVLRPYNTRDGYEVTFGWISNQSSDIELPNSNTVWTLANNNKTLTSENEIEFEWNNNTGQTFISSISMDGDYLFNINQRVINNSDDSIILNNASKIKRKTAPALSGMFILHEGLLGVLEEQLELIDYDELKDDGETLNFESNNGWIGITDKYWLAALIPDQTENFKAIYTYDNGYIAYFRSLKSSNVKPTRIRKK